MLSIVRKCGESMCIGHDIELTVISYSLKQVFCRVVEGGRSSCIYYPVGPFSDLGPGLVAFRVRQSQEHFLKPGCPFSKLFITFDYPRSVRLMRSELLDVPPGALRLYRAARSLRPGR